MLNHQQFGTYFHGTNTQFSPGDELRPPRETKNTFWGKAHPEDMDRVYSVGTKEIQDPQSQVHLENEGMTGMLHDPPHIQAEKLAWNYATQRVSQEPDKRGAVYEVAPHRPQQPLVDDVPGEVFSESAEVKRRIDIAPGRQGTFPQINWNQFASHLKKLDTSVMFSPDDEDAPEVIKDYNHPADPPYTPPEYRMNMHEDPADRRRREAMRGIEQRPLF